MVIDHDELPAFSLPVGDVVVCSTGSNGVDNRSSNSTDDVVDFSDLSSFCISVGVVMFGSGFVRLLVWFFSDLDLHIAIKFLLATS
jgi:hypothetical protein